MCYASLGKNGLIENVYLKRNIVFLHVSEILKDLKHDCTLELPVFRGVLANVMGIPKSVLTKILACLHHVCWLFTFLNGMYPGT